MSDIHWSCVRYAGIRDEKSAAFATMHGRRPGRTGFAHCDPLRRPLVLAGGHVDPSDHEASPFDVGRALTTLSRAVEATRPAGASIGAELLFIASPAWFRSANAESCRGSDLPDEEEAVENVSDDDGVKPRLPDYDADELTADLRALIEKRGWRTRWLSDVPSGGDDHRSAHLPNKLCDRWAALTGSVDGDTRNWLEDTDPRKVQAWVAAILVSLDARTDLHVACWRLDLDETTPHLSVFVLPVYEKTYKSGAEPKTRISVRKVFNGKRKLSALQDWLGEAVQTLGLHRGRSVNETNAQHMNPRMWRALKELNELLDAREARLAELMEFAATRLAEADARLRDAEAKEQDIETRMAALLALETDLEEREVQLSSGKSELAEREAAFAERIERLDEREQEVGRREIALGHESSRLTAVADALAKDRIDVGTTVKRLEAVEVGNAARTRELSGEQHRIDRADRALRARENEFETCREALLHARDALTEFAKLIPDPDVSDDVVAMLQDIAPLVPPNDGAMSADDLELVSGWLQDTPSAYRDCALS